MPKIQKLFTTDSISIEQLEKLYKEKFADKYEIKTQQTKVGNKRVPAIHIKKDAYHLTSVFVKYNEEAKKSFIRFNEEEVSWWIKLLGSSFGFIGELILSLIYGDGDGFYDDVQNVVKDNFKTEVEELNVGLSALGDMFKKK